MIVVDSSAVVHLALRGALGRLEPQDPTAPGLLRSEVTSALRQLAWRADISDEDARGVLAAVVSGPIDIRSTRRGMSDAYDLAAELGWAKTYDAEYLALAVRLGAPVLTVDARLARTAERLVGLVPLEDV